MAQMQRQDVSAELNDLSHQVVGCAIEVHRHLGPGLLESLYEEAMAYELRARSIPHVRQMDTELDACRPPFVLSVLQVP